MKTRVQAGFSLLELMAVILVIGMSLAMVSLTMRGGEPQEEVWNAIEQFMGLAQFASERAILAGETSALLIEPPEWQVQRGQSPGELGWRYSWRYMTPEGWKPIPNTPVVTLPPSVQLTVEINDLLWDYESQADRTTPVAAYYPTGEITPIRIELTDQRFPGFSQHIEVNELGELVWLEAPEPPERDEDGF